MAKTVRQWLTEARAAYPDDFDGAAQWLKDNHGIEPANLKDSLDFVLVPGGVQRPEQDLVVPGLSEEGDVQIGDTTIGSVPMSIARRSDIQEGLGVSLPVQETAKQQAEAVGEAFISAEREVPQVMTEPEDKEFVTRAPETDEEKEAFALGKAMDEPLLAGQFKGTKGITAADPVVMQGRGAYRSGKYTEFERKPEETVIEYGRRIRNNPELNAKAREFAKLNLDAKVADRTGQFFGEDEVGFAGKVGSGVLHAGGGLAGAIGGTGLMLGTEATFGLLSNIPGLPKSVRENLERQYYELQKNYDEYARSRGGESYKQGIDQTMQAMEKLQQDRLRRTGGYGFWTNVADDLGDNIAGIGELSSIVAPSFLDWIRDLETGKYGVKATADDTFFDKMSKSFAMGFAKGEQFPGAIAGAMKAIFASPEHFQKSLRTQPITTLMAFLPMARMLKSAGSASAGAVLDKINKMADRAGVNLRDPDLYWVDVPVNRRDQIIAQMRANLRTGAGRAIEARLAKLFLRDDFIDEAANALANNKPLPKMRLKDGFTSPKTAAQLAALTYGVSDGDVSDTMLALVPGALGVAHMAQLRKMAGTKGAARFQSRPKVAQAEAWTSRLFSNIATQLDPFGTMKASQFLDEMRAAVARGESDMTDLFNMVKQKMTKEDFDNLVQRAYQQRSEIIAQVDADPAVVAAYNKLEEAKEAAAKKPSEQNQAALTDAENSYRQLRTDTFQEEMGRMNLAVDLSEETGIVAGVAELQRKRARQEERNKRRLERAEENKKAAIAKAKAESAKAVAKLKKNNAVEKRYNEVRDTMRTRWGQSVEGNIAFLDELLESSKNKTAADLDALIASEQARVKTLQARLNNRQSGDMMTNEQRAILKEINDRQLRLLDDYEAVKRLGGDTDEAIAASRAQYVEYLQEQRAAAARSLQDDLANVQRRLEEEVGSKVQRDVAKQTARSDALIERTKKRGQDALDKIDDDLNALDADLRRQRVEALESIMGETRFGRTQVRYQPTPVVFTPKAGRGAVGSFDYLNPDELAIYRETGALPDGFDPRVVAPKIADASTQQGLPFSQAVQAINLFTPDDASVGLKALYRLSKDLAESDIGFNKAVDSLRRSALDLGSGQAAGVGGGVNLTRQFYMDMFGGILFDNASANLLRAPRMRQQFSKFVYNKLSEGQVLQGGATARKANLAAVEKLVNDFAFGRTRGSEFTVIDPVFQLATVPGEAPATVAMSKLFGKFIADEKRPGMAKLVRESQQDAITTMGNQLSSKLEEAAVAKMLAREFGTEAFLRSSVNNPSVAYLAEIAVDVANNGRLPMVLKGKPAKLESRLLTTAGGQGSAPNPSVVKRVMEITGKSETEAMAMVTEAASKLNRGTNSYTAWKQYALPSFEQQKAPKMAQAEASAGIVGKKMPVAGEDMSGHSRILGDLGDMYVDSNFGGSMTSTLGWAFSSTRAMNQGDSFLGMMRNTSSAIKRNLTTQRPATALTNVVSNVFAKMTRDGSLPEQVYIELMNNAQLWRTFTKNPEKLSVVEQGRLKAIFDKGLRNANLLNGEANMVLDAYYSNPAYRAADNLTSGWRKLPVVGTIMKTADAAYQAGDSIFKLTDTRKALRQLDEDVFDMAPGTSYTFVDPSQNNKLLGTVYRVKSEFRPFRKDQRKLRAKTKRELREDTIIPPDEYEVVIGNRTYKGAQALDKLEQLKIDASVGYANSLYFDYNVVPGWVTLARNWDALGFGPFKTWAWKSLDLPFIKKGMGTQAVFGKMPALSTDPFIAARQYRRQSFADMRRASILLATRDTETQGDNVLKQALPQWVAMASWLEPGSYVAQSMGTRNFTIGLANAIEAMQGFTRSETDKKIQQALNRKRPPTREIARILWDTGLVTGLFTEIATSEDRYQRAIEPKDYFALIGARLIPGFIQAGIDTAATIALDKLPADAVLSEGQNLYEYFSTYDRSLENNQAVRYDIGSHLLRIWTGRRLMELDPDQAAKVVNALASITDKEIKRELKKEQKKLQARYGKQKLPPEGEAKLEALALHLEKTNKFVSEVYAAEAKRLGDAIDAKDREETKAKKAVEQRTEVPPPLAPVFDKMTEADGG